MESLHRQVRLARRRLSLECFFRALAWFWFAALVAAAAAIGFGKLWPLGIDQHLWATAWVGGSIVAGLLAAIVWTFIQRRSLLDAAIEVDHRFGLKERVSSALALDSCELTSEAGQALIADAAKKMNRLDVSQHFRVALDRRALLPIAPALIACGLALFVDERGSDNSAAAITATNAGKKEVIRSGQELQKKLAERRKESRDKGLSDAESIFKKLEEGSKDLIKGETADRKQALVKLNDLAKDLEKRRENLAADDKLKQQLGALKDLHRGPADQLAQALKKGELRKAVNELEKLKNQIARGELDENAKQQMARQLDQMKQTVDKMTQAHEEAKQELKQQIARARQAGQTAAAEKLQEQLDKLNQQNKQMAKATQMADKLAEASQAMKQGQSKDAQAALNQLGQDLEKMQQDLDEMAMLDGALDQIADAKDAMNCEKCGGAGCEVCRRRGPIPGDGLGQGRGFGERPEEKTKTSFYDSSVKQNVGRGAAVMTDLVEGPNRKGEVQEEIKQNFEASKRETEDPLTGQRLPHDYREHAKKYFDSLREGRR